MAKNNKNKAMIGAAAIVAAGLGIWYAIKSGLFGGGSSSKGGNTYYYYTNSDGQQQSSNSWQNALISAGGQLGAELINLIKEISKGKQGAQAEQDLKQIIATEYGYSNITDLDAEWYANFVETNKRKPTREEWINYWDSDF